MNWLSMLGVDSIESGMNRYLMNASRTAMTEDFAAMIQAQQANLKLTTGATIQANALKTLTDASSQQAGACLEMQKSFRDLANKISIN